MVRRLPRNRHPGTEWELPLPRLFGPQNPPTYCLKRCGSEIRQLRVGATFPVSAVTHFSHLAPEPSADVPNSQVLQQRCPTDSE